MTAQTKLVDPAAEKYVLSSLYNLGYENYILYADFLSEEVFVNDKNKIFFAILKYIYSKLEIKSVDIGTFHSSAKDLGLNLYINDEKNAKHFSSIMNFPVSPDNVEVFVKKLNNLYIARQELQILDLTKEKILNISGNESPKEILSIAEADILDFSLKYHERSNEDKNIFSNIDVKFIEHLNLKDENKWINTGFSRYDASIGGGLRPGTVNVIGAFYKTGKSMLGMNIGYNVALSGIPVLMIDLEMTTKDFCSRFYSKLVKSPISAIETGGLDDARIKIAMQYIDEVKDKNYVFQHCPVAGLGIEEQFMEIRRWIHNIVGVGNQCLIIYDYLKLTSSEYIKNMQEYQAMGFFLTYMHEFAVKYNVPFLSFVQLNEEGGVAQSSRIKWFCSNYSEFKMKSDEEIALDPEINGTHKLFPRHCRHGEGLRYGDYINILFDKRNASMIEGRTKFELENIK